MDEPHDNSKLQKGLTVGKVTNMSIDMFLDSSKVAAYAKDAKAASIVGEAASAEDAATELEKLPTGPAKESIAELAKRMPRRPWKIGESVERGYEIPIGITSESPMPDFGSFKRLAMDIVVNAVWLALFWARQEGTRKLQQR